MKRRAVVAVLAIVGCSDSEESIVEQAALTKLSTPTVSVLGTTATSIQVRVCAGPTGAKAGFTLQWISEAGRAAGGWDNNPETCDGSFSGQAQASSFALAANECTTIDLGTDHLDAPGMTLSCDDLDCHQRYLLRAFAHAYSQGPNVFSRSDYTADVDAATGRCPQGNGKIPRDVRLALGRLGNAEALNVDDDGVPQFVRGELGQPGPITDDDPVLADMMLRPALPDAIAPFRVNASALALRKVNRDDDGTRHFRYQQQHNGLDVVGGDLVVSVDSKGTIYAVNGTARGDIWPHVGQTPVGELAASDAVARDPRFANLQPGSIRTVYLHTGEGETFQAYELEVTGERGPDPVRDLVYVDVDSGNIVAVHPQIHHAKNRATYNANHLTSVPGTLARSEGQTAVNELDVDAAHDNAGITYDAYKMFWNRDSYNNAGATLKSSVHYSNGYCNAFWNGSQMVYGDGSLSQNCYPLARALDVAGHELTHAVTAYESNLTYSGESGGINESLSDVFGAFAEAFEAGGSNGTLVVSDNVWLIGEEVLPPYLRSMCDPKADGVSADLWTSSLGLLDVHYSSGVGNLMFCLLTRGGVHPRGKTTVEVPGIGMDKAIRIVYYAATNVLTSSSNYAAYRTAMLMAVDALYGSVSPERTAVEKAFEAVGIGAVVSPDPSIILLTNATPVSNLSGTVGSVRYFKIDVPTGMTSLKVIISGGTGDADLYVKYGSLPTTSSYNCRPYLNGNSETCSFTNPAAGPHYIMLRGYSSYSGVTITATYSSTSSDGTTVLANGVPVSNISGSYLSQKYWKIAVPAGLKVVVTISGGSGDADLYTRFGAKPTTSTYSCRPYLYGNNETCILTAPSAGDYYIMLRGYSSYTGVTLTAMY